MGEIKAAWNSSSLKLRLGRRYSQSAMHSCSCTKPKSLHYQYDILAIVSLSSIKEDGSPQRSPHQDFTPRAMVLRAQTTISHLPWFYQLYPSATIYASKRDRHEFPVEHHQGR